MSIFTKHSKLYQYATIWIFLLLAIISGVISFNAYVGNSRTAAQLYKTLTAVDEAGGDVEKALFDLRSYIYSHMNTKIGSETGIKPPIQLQGTYKRLVAAEEARVKQANDDLYNKAQVDCEKRFPAGLSGSNRIPCITEYVSNNAIKPQTIPKGLYQYDFVPPAWSPDTAGIGMVLSVLFLCIYLFRLYTHRKLLHHSKSY